MATPDEAIEAIRATGGAQPGSQALHAKGKLYRGTFTATQPRFVKALPVVKEANKIPAGYGTVAYRGLHAFRWIAADGSARFVRYHLASRMPARTFCRRTSRKPKAQTFWSMNSTIGLRPNRFGSTTRSRSPRRASTVDLFKP